MAQGRTLRVAESRGESNEERPDDNGDRGVDELASGEIVVGYRVLAVTPPTAATT